MKKIILKSERIKGIGEFLSDKTLDRKALLDISRQELLDLGLRNPLINHGKNRGLKILNGDSSSIYNNLVIDGKSCSFQPLEEESAAPVNSDIDDSKNDNKSIGYHSRIQGNGNRLLTALDPEKLATKLLRIFSESRTIIEEQGINALYLALGMFHWLESPSSQIDRAAPLVLIPIELQRGNALEKFKAKYSGGEIDSNLSLYTKMKNDFNLVLPDFPDQDDFIFSQYIGEVKSAIFSSRRFYINENEVVLGFFSFNKFLMYKDLDGSNWPENNKPHDAKIFDFLFGDGFTESASQISEEAFLDDLPEFEDVSFVFNADSSQTSAILDIRHGMNLVVKGPPGTGKSQTIANIISDGLAQGKKILFVSEKMAALEVVKRRLDSVGLGDACLELHSHKTNKKDVLAELKRTFELGKPKYKDDEGFESRLRDVKKKLNEYCDAIKTPILDSRTTPIMAIGHISKLNAQFANIEKYSIFGNPIVPNSSRALFLQNMEMLNQVQNTAATINRSPENPFLGVTKKEILPSDIARIEELFTNLQTSIKHVIFHSNIIGHLLLDNQPENLPEAMDAIAVSKAILNSGEFLGASIDIELLMRNESAIRTAFAYYQQIEKLHGRHRDYISPEAWNLDFSSIKNEILQYRKDVFRLFKPQYRAARNAAAMLYKKNRPIFDKKVLLLMADIENERYCRAALLDASEVLEKSLGLHWKDNESDWTLIMKVVETAKDINKKVSAGTLPIWIFDVFRTPVHIDNLKIAVDNLQNSVDTFYTLLNEAADTLECPSAKLISDNKFGIILQALEFWQSQTGQMSKIVHLNHLGELCANSGLHEYFKIAQVWNHADYLLADLYSLQWYKALLDEAYKARPILRNFDADGQFGNINTFKDLDKRLLAQTMLRLADKHWSEIPRYEANGQVGILRNEFEKKRRLMPLRKLLDKSGRAIQAIKPVFMMSPMSIATYLVPDACHFDLVVFDEASQVKPVEAFGALIRAKQAVVVGDEKQMPPTSFFDRTVSSDDEIEDDEEVPIGSDKESILKLFLGKGCPSKELRWHYRSKHESLIAVSNYKFYQNGLVLFPSPDEKNEKKGIRLRHYPETSYDRGGSRTNREEARLVAEAVIRHAQEEQNSSLLVVAFSKTQAHAIEDELEILRRKHKQLEDFFSSSKVEPFKVRNLETVQGDERDVVFISVGYGKSSDGYVSMNFGPLNKEDGWRRLNVLITRARSRCEIFTNMTSSDIDCEKAKSAGVEALKTYLEYAETGRLGNSKPNLRDDDSPFEYAVYEALTSLGLNVEKQIGTAGFFIDMAIVDPSKPGKYILGIECDGATYHSARSARDRDRLRQYVLETLGWKLHRIWSADWLVNKSQEINRLLEAYNNALAEQKKSESVPKHDISRIERENSGNSTGIRSDSMPRVENSGNEYICARLNINLCGNPVHLLGNAFISNLINQVVTVESPVHTSEVFRRITSACGIKRQGNRITAAFESAVAYGVSKRAYTKRSDFLWTNEMSEKGVLFVRNRNSLPPASYKLEFVAPEEIEYAVKEIAMKSFEIARIDLPTEVCRLFGFSRSSSGMASSIDSVIGNMIKEGRVRENKGLISV